MGTTTKTNPVCRGLVLCSVVAAATAGAQDISFIAMRTFVAYPDLGRPSRPQCAAVGEWNGEGVFDLIVAGTHGDPAVLRATGGGSFPRHRTGRAGTAPRSRPC